MRRRAKHSYLLLLAFLTAHLCWGTSAWTIENVDPAGGGMFTSLRVDTNGGVHVAYLNGGEQTLKYAFRDPLLGRWFTTALDGASSGFCSLTLDSKQYPHISHIGYGNGKLKYAFWDGSAWKNQTLAIPAREISYYTSISVDSKDRPRISFYEYFDADQVNSLRLRTTNWNGEYWELRTVDDDRGSGKFNFIAIDSLDNPHIAYANVDYGNATLRYADWDGKIWHPMIIEGVGGSDYGVYSVSLMLGPNDVPHIAYTHTFERQVKYMTRSEGKWVSENVGPVQKVSYPDRNGIALDDEGKPYVSYYDEGSGVLKIAHRGADGWVSEVVDRGFAGFMSSLQIRNGEIWVSYRDNLGLRVAHRKIEPMPPNTPDRPLADPGSGSGSGKEIRN